MMFYYLSGGGGGGAGGDIDGDGDSTYVVVVVNDTHVYEWFIHSKRWKITESAAVRYGSLFIQLYRWIRLTTCFEKKSGNICE